jgi:hypothetical protein
MHVIFKRPRLRARLAGGGATGGHLTNLLGRWKLCENARVERGLDDRYSRARRQAPGLKPTMPVNTRVRWL